MKKQAVKKQKKKNIKPGFSVTKDKAGKFRWRVVGDNYEIVGASSQGFTSSSKAKANAALLKVMLP